MPSTGDGRDGGDPRPGAGPTDGDEGAPGRGPPGDPAGVGGPPDDPDDDVERAAAVTRRSLPLALVPVVATLLDFDRVARALAAGAGGGVTFPMPPGLATLWTYASLPAGPVGGGPGGPLSLVAWFPLFVLSLVVVSAMEAGFLGALSDRIDGRDAEFVPAVRRYTLRMVGVNVVRFAVVVAAVPFLVLGPLALIVAVALGYLVYGLPFEIVARDSSVGTALSRTVDRATDGGRYAGFALAHLLGGAAASLALSSLVRVGVLGIAVGAAVVAVPAVFVSAYGLLLFRGFDRPDVADRPDATGA
jgi:hypothetical protein